MFRRIVRIFAALAGAALAGCSNAHVAEQSSRYYVPSVSSARITEPTRVGSSSADRVGPGDVAMANNGVVEHVHFMPTRLRSSNSSQPSSASIGYPLDMTDGNGPKMSTSEAYNVYVNCNLASFAFAHTTVRRA